MRVTPCPKVLNFNCDFVLFNNLFIQGSGNRDELGLSDDELDNLGDVDNVDVNEGSSDEEDSSNEALDRPDQYEEDGFLVDDLEVEKDLKVQKKRKRLRKGTKRKHLELEEEDLELIKENLGIVDSPDGTKQDGFVKVTKKDEKVLEKMLFPEADDIVDSTSKDEEEEEEEFLSDEDSWIVDDEDDGEKRKRRRRKQQLRHGLLTSERLRAADDLYNFDEYMDMMKDEGMFDTSGYQEETDKYQMYLKKGYEPSLLEERFLTQTDEVIRDTDIPERLQLRFPNREPPTQAEIQKEAEWIYNHLFPEYRYSPNASTISKIGNILQFLLVDYFEIPFIATYRREYWLPDLSRKHLWDIYDLDEKYFYFIGRKLNLSSMIEKIDDLDLTTHVEFADNEQEALDALENMQLHHHNITENSSDLKRPESKDLYSRAKREGIRDLIRYFGLTSKEVAKNLEFILMREDHRVTLPDPLLLQGEEAHQYFLDTVQNLRQKRKFASEQDRINSVLNSAALVMGKELAFEPSIRKHLRPLYFASASISTKLISNSKKQLSKNSPYHEIKELNHVPIMTLVDEKFLLILNAKKEGFIDYSLQINEDVYQYDLKNKLERAFLANSISDIWNQYRKKAIEYALSYYLIPRFEKQAQATLKKNADEYIINMCAEKLEQMLMAGPYKPPEHQALEDQSIRIMACSVSERFTDCVQLNHFGEVESILTVGTALRFRQYDQDQLTKFIKTFKPCVIVVGTDSKSWHFFRPLQTIVEGNENIRCIFANTDVADAFIKTKMSVQEFPTYTENVRRAVSLGRQLLDPLLQVCTLNNSEDLLRYAFHPNAHLADQEVLLKKLQRCFINVTNAAGVDINNVIKYKWMHPILYSLCGLGPRKTQHLIQTLTNKGFLETREDLEAILQPVVTRNIAGFIKIPHGISGEDEDPVEILDLTRIHPEHYDLAKKVAKDAMKDSLEENDEDDYVEALLRHPENLDKIDIDYFATQLEERGLKKRLTLEDIKNELNNPYADCREMYRELTLEEVERLIAEKDRIPEVEQEVQEPKESDLWGSLMDAAPAATTSFLKRNIVHPLFQNINGKTAAAFLKDKEPLTFVIRPSSNSVSKLVITMKFFMDIVFSIEVDEEDKPTDASLGNALRIGTEKFSGLDDLIVNFVDPIILFAELMRDSEYYKELSRQDVETYLLKKKSENAHIPYCISPSVEHPGCFQLFYIPGTKTVVYEVIGLRHEGFRFNHRNFKKPSSLIKYFKVNFKRLQAGRSRR